MEYLGTSVSVGSVRLKILKSVMMLPNCHQGHRESHAWAKQVAMETHLQSLCPAFPAGSLQDSSERPVVSFPSANHESKG